MVITVEKTKFSHLKVEITGEYFKLGDVKGEIIEKCLPFLNDQDFNLEYNGRILRADDQVASVFRDGEIKTVLLVPRLVGGKGGFGSMLRAIGAQIEKTTNRDACRDLSGRRLRDINEEQRLKKWFARQAEREQEKKEAKKRKLEKLRQVADGPPLPKIDDQDFLQQREDIVDAVFEAVDEAFRESSKDVDALTVHNESSNSSSSKPETIPEATVTEPDNEPCASGSSQLSQLSDTMTIGSSVSSIGSQQRRKPIKKTMFDEDLDSDSSSEDESDSAEPSPKKAKA